MTVINPTLHTAALAALESALDRALALAPGGEAALAPLAGKVFALHCTAPTLDAYLQAGPGGLRLMGVYDGPVTTSVRGRAADFAELATASDPAAALINGELELKGDSAPLLELQRAIAGLEVDWEAPLVDVLGDIAGHQLAELLRGGFRWGRQAGSGLARQLEEFIHEEARLSPPRAELEDFYRDVLSLGIQVERLESRLARLRRQLAQLPGRD